MPYEQGPNVGQSSSQREHDDVAQSEGATERKPAKSSRNRGRSQLERAHKTLTSSVEAPLGAPRSGSA
ncbi:MAG: hypothetical protein AVDCRST_MAG38-814 [uncultured Solirubrobacteraceae bacterium]|uniref:Uncharacterized protein n=1 Tax=uncultured Solirubrobacteraceae bacterium TaxID=1162706 RepID=A0A6J4R7K9_9ACTN|nr:MAG: hypothetical protein AVDCRST_MAG38-814 [uncultured Solirubrobacteraceae bacterium]